MLLLSVDETVTSDVVRKIEQLPGVKTVKPLRF